MSFRALLHCSARKCPEIGEYFGGFRRIHHALGEEDADHSLSRIGVCGCAVAAGPAESAWGVEDLSTLDVYRHSEAPAGIVAEKDFGACSLLGLELIGGHEFHGG